MKIFDEKIMSNTNKCVVVIEAIKKHMIENILLKTTNKKYNKL